MDRVVAPFDHTYPPTVVCEELSVMVLPGQILVDPLAVTVGVAGVEDTVTAVAAEVALHDPEVTVTVRLQVVVTVMDCAVDPFDHKFPVELLELSTTLPPGQKDTGPLALIVGVGIEEETVTTTIADVTVVPLFVTFTL